MPIASRTTRATAVRRPPRSATAGTAESSGRDEREVEDDARDRLGRGQPAHADLGHGGEDARPAAPTAAAGWKSPRPGFRMSDDAQEPDGRRAPEAARERLAQPDALDERHESGSRVVEQDGVGQAHVRERVEEAVHRGEPGQRRGEVVARSARVRSPRAARARAARAAGPAGRGALRKNTTCALDRLRRGELHRHAHARRRGARTPIM